MDGLLENHKCVLAAMCVCSRVRCVFAPMRVDYMCVCLCFSEFVCFLMCAKVCFSHVCVWSKLGVGAKN